MLGLFASSLSDDFSVPLLVAGTAAAVGWIVVATVAAIARRPPRIRAHEATVELPPESPAVAGLLVNDFLVPAEVAPAILLDLAARHVVDLDEVQPGKTICRVRATANEELRPFESRVLASLQKKAIDGVVPTEALTTGPETESKSWHRALRKEVVAETQGTGLTRDRWPKSLITTLAVLLVAAILLGGYSLKGDEGSDSLDTPVLFFSIVAVGLAFILIAVYVTGRMGTSLAQLPTEAGLDAASRDRALERHLHEDRLLRDLPPAAVKIRGRHFAYAAAFGSAPLAVELLPMGTEDDHRAWSRFGGRWRKVRVRYPRAWPPAWGKHPAFALLLGVFWGAVALLAIKGLAALVDDRWSGLSRDSWDKAERAGYLAMIPFALLLVWAALVLVRALPDLRATREITGDVVRDRKFRQWNSSSDNPSYWYYLAVDDGGTDHVQALRLRRELWSTVSQGDTVTAEITPRLKYVRSIQPASQESRSSG